jgi:hypothetical protein
MHVERLLQDIEESPRSGTPCPVFSPQFGEAPTFGCNALLARSDMTVRHH